MKDFSYITNSHPAFIENLYSEFVKNSESVDPDLRKFFEGFDFAIGNGHAATPAQNGTAAATGADSNWRKELGAYRMILGYRNKGHLIAKTNPIRERRDRNANLTLSFFGLDEQDMDKTFQVGERIGLGATTLRNILGHLQKVYAGPVGIEYKYISDQNRVNWLATEMEKKFADPVPLEKRNAFWKSLTRV